MKSRFCASLLGIGLAALISAPFAGTAHAQSDKVVATVNGESITEADLEMAAENLERQVGPLPKEQRRATALSSLIDIRLFSAEAKAKGFDKDEKFKRNLEFLEMSALHAEAIEKEVAASVTEEAVRKRYDEDIARSTPVNEIHARHILVKTKEEAEAIIKQLDAGGKFEDIAKEHSKDPGSGAQGGDLGWFGPGIMVPDFEKAAFELTPGTYTKEPVKSQFGFHIIKVEEKRAKQPASYDQVKERIKGMLVRARYMELSKSLRAAAKVEVTDPDLKQSVDEIEKEQ